MKPKLPATEVIMKSEAGELKKTSSPDEVRTQTRPKDSQATEESQISETSLTTAGQRKINLIWEITQMIIAYFGVGSALFVDSIISLRIYDIDTKQMAALMQLNSMAALILGFYFSRTNHAAIGGIGNKTQAPYEGR